ncbi:hypothetical protein PV767_04025 [Stenotrophomonas rhizophila]
MNRRYRIAWAVIGAVAAIVLPLRLVEISQAHADRDANQARWAASSSVRG